jgi:hypothetical protein
VSESYTVGLFTIAGVVLTFLFDQLRSERAARFEERKHFRELGLKVAILKYERNAALAQQVANLKGPGAVVETPPLEVFVIKGIKFMEIVATPNLSADAAIRRLTELEDFTSTVIDANKK